MKNAKELNNLVIGLVLAILLVGMPLNTNAASPGALDGTFSTDGKVITNAGGADTANSAIIQPDGKIIVVGRTDSGGGVAIDFLVIRYNPDGSLDTTFDTDGIVTTNFGNIDIAQSVAIQPDGKIVVVGESAPVGGTSDFAVARYNPNGSLDTTFDTDGKVITDFNALNDRAFAVVIQADGKIVAGGNVIITAGFDFGLARYNTNGSLDTTFNTDGKANFDSGGTNIASDIALQFDGKIVAAGGDGNTDFAVYRINTNGTFDTTFDTDGFVITDISAGDAANSVAIQPDGKIIAAGFSDGGSNSSLARYNPNGSLDTTFDTDGKVLVNFVAGNDSIQDIELQPDGKIVAALSGTGSPFFGTDVTRFNSNGSLDTSFGNNGLATSFISGSSSTDVVISGDNLLAVGNNAGDVTVAQFNLNIQSTQSNDFDGDGFADYVIFRPSTANWFVLRSSDQTVQILAFGTTGDVPLDADFDGDGKADLAIFPSFGGTMVVSEKFK